MRLKSQLYRVVLSGIVLFSIFFQSIHSYEHLSEQMSQSICLHEENDNTANITHAHIHFENCFVCQFSFSPLKLSESFLLSSTNFELSTNYTLFKLNEIVTISFKGSLFALRAPPLV